MKKTIYICDRCNGETKKKFLYNVNITFKNSKSNTFLTTIKKDICLKCIKDGNSDNIENLDADIYGKIQEFDAGNFI